MTSQRASTSLPSSLSLQNLRQTATWMRDHLDPVIAREGPDVMHPNDVLVLHDLFKDLQNHNLDRDTVATSRIHHAVREVSGKATRWPHKLIDECDKIIGEWETRYGPLQEIRVPLYGRGGRLFKVCTMDDLTREDLLTRWTRQSLLLVDNGRAYTHWQDEIEPGQWWINALFAFRDGIIDSKTTDGGICTDGEMAYAVVLKNDDEVEGSSACKFTYRCRSDNKERYRLTAANFKTRYPLRILRSHSLASLWAPKAGIRYDGLYTVRGWSIKPTEQKDQSGIEYHVTFEREPGQTAMDQVLLSPNSEDIDDYREYKRLRRLQREWMRRQATSSIMGRQAPTLMHLEKQVLEKYFLDQTISKDGQDLSQPAARGYATEPRKRNLLGNSAPRMPRSRNDSSFTAPRQLQPSALIGSVPMGTPGSLQRTGQSFEDPEPSKTTLVALDETRTPDIKAKRNASARVCNTPTMNAPYTPGLSNPYPVTPPISPQAGLERLPTHASPVTLTSAAQGEDMTGRQTYGELSIPFNNQLQKSAVSSSSTGSFHTASSSVGVQDQDSRRLSHSGTSGSKLISVGEHFDGAHDLLSNHKSGSSLRQRMTTTLKRRSGNNMRSYTSDLTEQLDLIGSEHQVGPEASNPSEATPCGSLSSPESSLESQTAQEDHLDQSTDTHEAFDCSLNFRAPNWTGPSASTLSHTTSSDADTSPSFVSPGRHAAQNWMASNTAMARARFQTLARTAGVFSNSATARRFLLALTRVWDSLANAEYPDYIVPHSKRRLAPGEDIDRISYLMGGPEADVEGQQALNFVDVHALGTCSMSIWDPNHECSRSFRVDQRQGAMALAKKVAMDVAARETAGQRDDETVEPLTG